MFIGRERDLELAVSLIRNSASVDIVGTRGSGRSSFLEALHARSEEFGRVVIRVRGIAALRSQPLAALSVAGFDAPLDVRPTVGAIAASIATSAKDRSAVILVDDWDDLDDASWGVLEAVRSMWGFPIVATRLRGAAGRRSPGEGSALEPSYVVELRPLDFEPMQRILHERLGGQSDVATVARIFSKSGGIVGLALSITDIAVQEQRVVQGDDRRWTAVKPLWSPALRGVVEGHLDNLEPAALDGVNLLALVGVADVDTARALVDWEVIESLEDEGLLQFTTNEGRQFLAVTPPLIVEYIRNEPRTARHVRLTDVILERLGADHPLAVAAAHTGSRALGTAPNNAVFSRMLQERIRNRRLFADARWKAQPEPAEAVALVEFLLQSAASHDDIQFVFDNTDMNAGDEQSHTRLQILRAKWTAYAMGDLDGALNLLTRDAYQSEDRVAQYIATSALLLASLSKVPDDLRSSLLEADTPSSTGQVALLEARQYLAVIQGRFTEAEALYDEICTLDADSRRHVSGALHAYALTGLGRVKDALAVADVAMGEAHGRLDLDALRTYGSAAVLAHIFVGDFDAVDRILDTLLTIGESHTLPRGYIVAVLNVAAIVALRRGDLALSERYVDEIAGVRFPDGPLPGQDASWSRAQLVAATGDTETAAHIIWESSEALWERGALFSAALGYISSLELHPIAERHAHARPRMAAVEGAYVRAAEHYVAALVAGDPDLMLDAARTLHASGRIAYAVQALRAAIHLFSAQGRLEDSERAREEERALLNSASGQIFDSARMTMATQSLSSREREVAHFAADGFSNAEIAAALRIGVRTVESHMYRVMRKLDLAQRTDLLLVKHML